MNVFYIIYLVITSAAFIILSPFLFLYAVIGKRSLKGLNERLGWVSLKGKDYPEGAPNIWIHAASLGEVRVAETIIGELKRLLPASSITVSTMTEHGKRLASEILGKDIRVIYSPLDIIFFVRMAIKRIKPDILVFLETEIWPAWISEAARMGVKPVIVNGRISPGSFPRYMRLRPLFRYVLLRVEALSMISEKDKERITDMGADPAKVIVSGNAKFDLLAELADPSIEDEIRNLFRLDGKAPVFIAGSTRNGEEEIIIEAYRNIIKEFPETILFIAPRHIKRSGHIASLLEKNRLEYQFRSEFGKGSGIRERQVVILDTFGELFRLYSAGTVIFCGGSLAPLGGQNPLEAAVWGRPVLYGPSMEHFLDAKAILEGNNAGIEVSTPEMLAEKVIMLFKDRPLREEYGSRAREAVLKSSKAAKRHAEIVADILSGTH
ncbi:MAG: 3-deoxy-D-manno-octulosonic acid transferase [Deltaproteobacteria bacterium]|nr:3-deoxy-D-manno-octulosonic acid transferase [Deltaproteobacteria bacterium]